MSLSTQEAVQYCLKHWLRPQNANDARSVLEQFKKIGSSAPLPVRLVLPQEVEGGIDRLYVREVYVKVYEVLERTDNDLKRLAVSGLSGAGKSVLGVYCFLRRVLEAKYEDGTQAKEDLFFHYSCGYHLVTAKFAEDGSSDIQYVDWKRDGIYQHTRKKQVKWIVFDLSSKDVAREISNAAATDWINVVILPIMSPASLKDDNNKYLFRKDTTKKFVYPDWEEDEFKELLKYCDYKLLVRSVGFIGDLEAMLQRQRTFPTDEFESLNHKWFVRREVKLVEYHIKERNKPNYKVDEGLMKPIVDKVFQYRRRLIGSNLRLLFRGSLEDQISGKLQMSEVEFCNSFFKFVPHRPEWNDNFQMITWKYKPVAVTETIQNFYDVVKLKDFLEEKLKKSSLLERVQMAWSFETVCVSTLATTGKFNFRVLKGKNEVYSFKLPDALQLFDEFSLVSLLSRNQLMINRLFVPQNFSQPVIDFVIYTYQRITANKQDRESMLLIQATIAKKHDIKINRLTEIVSHLYHILRNPKKVDWYFVFYIESQNFTGYPQKVVVEFDRNRQTQKGKRKRENKVRISLPVYIIRLLR